MKQLNQMEVEMDHSEEEEEEAKRMFALIPDDGPLNGEETKKSKNSHFAQTQ